MHNDHDRHVLVTPKTTWPRNVASNGLGMEKLENSVYSLTHSEKYKSLEFVFYQCIATHNPDTLHEILGENPYHLAALLQLSEAFKQSGDIEHAADFVERILYSFEVCLHPSFSISTPSTLDYDRIESRIIFIAIYRHIQYLARRGCYRYY